MAAEHLHSLAGLDPSQPLGLDAHLQIAAAAQRLGVIGAARCVERLLAIELAGAVSARAAWVDTGALSADALDLVMQGLGGSAAPIAPRSAEVRSVEIQVSLGAPLTTEVESERPGESAEPSTPEGQRDAASPGAGREAGARDAATISYDAASNPAAPTKLAAGVEPALDRPSSSPPVTSRGRYLMRGVLGEGGLGEVVECFDAVLNRHVAVKSTRVELQRDAGTRRILEREARIVSRLEHPNIIPVYDAGWDSLGGPYYVMREVTQPSLDHVLERLRAGDAEVARDHGLKRLLRFFVQICRAVDYAHSRGVVHCDLKPANVLIGDFGEVLVVDWGLAFCEEMPNGPRGGTPGYMAPEQFDPFKSAFDARTDVFALGAILYRMLTLAHPFERAQPATDAKTSDGSSIPPPYQPFVPPRRRAPERDIPVELEEICERALAFEPAARWPTARALADAVDEWIEGTREAERRREEAERAVEQADELAERCHEFDESRPAEIERLGELRAAVTPWEPVEAKQELWNAEDMLAVTDSLRARTLQAAVAAYEQALDAVPSHPRARRGLARLYSVELERARRRRDEVDQLHYELLLERYDDGTLLGREGRDGRLSLELALPAPGIEVRVVGFREVQRRLVAGDEQRLDAERLAPLDLRPGTWLVELRGGERCVRHPVLVRPGAELRLTLDPALLEAARDGEQVVPGGPALLGGSDRLDGELRELDVPTFSIRTRPETFRRWVEFLDALADRDLVERHVPRTSGGVPLLWRQAGRWQPTPASADLGEALFAMPVFGVAAESAEAFSRWVAAQSGGDWRLPRDDEWEKAARGSDGRAYPWGNHFDPTFCKMRFSRPGSCRPEPSGAFASDVSPYGVVDVSGGIADWTVPADEPSASPASGLRFVFARGGAWCDWPADCRLTARRRYLATEHAERVGVRLARALEAAPSRA